MKKLADYLGDQETESKPKASIWDRNADEWLLSDWTSFHASADKALESMSADPYTASDALTIVRYIQTQLASPVNVPPVRKQMLAIMAGALLEYASAAIMDLQADINMHRDQSAIVDVGPDDPVGRVAGKVSEILSMMSGDPLSVQPAIGLLSEIRAAADGQSGTTRSMLAAMYSTVLRRVNSCLMGAHATVLYGPGKMPDQGRTKTID